MTSRIATSIGLALSIVATAAATSHAASFGCSSSAARLSVLGQAVEPVTANSGTGACSADTSTLSGPAAALPSPVSASALVASTEVYPAQKSVLARGGVSELKVASLPNLPITLPQVTVPDAARALLANALKVNVDLTAVKLLLPANLPTDLVTNLVTNLVTTLVTNLPTNLPTNLVLDLLNPALDTPLEVLAANNANAITNAANLATNTANAATNAANTITNAANLATNLANAATNAANAALNTLRASIPSSVAFDGSATLDALLATLLPDGKLPNLELLSIKGALANAAGSCQSGTAGVSGSSSVQGVKVFGQDLTSSAGQAIDQVLTLINSANVDPSNVTVPSVSVADLGLTDAQKALIATLPAAGTALDSALQAARTAIQAALDALDPIHVLDPTVAQVKVAPGQQVKSGGAVTQQALTALVTIAGQKILEAVIGEAKVASAGVDCDDPVVDPDNPVDVPDPGEPGAVIDVPGIEGPVDTSTPEGAALQCSTRRLVLVDVLERAGRVKLFGVADPALAGKTVSIVFEASHKVVAHAKIAKDGSFDTTAPLPPRNVRDTNDARYTAVLGKEESINLKLRRRMIITSTSARGRNVTIVGRVIPPLGKPLQPITITRRVSCTKESVVKVFRPRPNGRFRITVQAPKGLGTVVYRMTTEVRDSPQGTALFKTYTLPRAVDLT